MHAHTLTLTDMCALERTHPPHTPFKIQHTHTNTHTHTQTHTQTHTHQKNGSSFFRNIFCGPCEISLVSFEQMKLPYEWQADIVDIQIFRIGQLVILGVPGEFT